jgi:hypothetical protein
MADWIYTFITGGLTANQPVDFVSSCLSYIWKLKCEKIRQLIKKEENGRKVCIRNK